MKPASISTRFRFDASPDVVELVTQAMRCFDAVCADRSAPSHLVDEALPYRNGSRMRMAGLRRALMGHLGTPLGLDIVGDETGAVIQGSGRLNIAAMAELLRLLAPTSLPITMQWANDAGPVSVDTCLAGWLVIHRHEVVAGDLNEAIRHETDRMDRRRSPNELQRTVAEAYAVHDDGRMLEVLDEEKGPIEDRLRSRSHGDALAAFVYLESCDAADPSEAAGMLRSAAEQLKQVAGTLIGEST
jgi:hypothetical protein